MEAAIRSSPAHLVGIEVEGARQEDGVERQPVGGREDLGVHDVAAGGRAGARHDGEEARMVGRHERSAPSRRLNAVGLARLVATDRRLPSRLRAHEPGMRELAPTAGSVFSQ